MNQFELAKEHFLNGLGLFNQQNYPAAEYEFRCALGLMPGRASILTNLSATLIRLGKFFEAIEFANKAVSLDAQSVDGWLNLGICLNEASSFDQALAAYDKVLTINPQHVEAWTNRGVTLNDMKRHEDALLAYDKALSIHPRHTEAWYNRGITFNRMQRHDEARQACDRALDIDPGHVKAWTNRGVTLEYLRRCEEALAAYDKALHLDPRHADAWANRGATLNSMGRHEQALASCDKSLDIKPDHVEAWVNHGASLNHMNRHGEALASYDKAIGINPSHLEAWTNKGMALNHLNRYAEALESFKRALGVNPEHAEAHWNESLTRLVLGEFEPGWEKYESRWGLRQAAPQRHADLPLWLGQEDIAGKRLLVWFEQGFGDTLQFCRYASLLKSRGAEVVLEVQAPLAKLIANSLDCEVHAEDHALPECDFQIPLLSLPLAFKTHLANIPARNPYLEIDPAKVASWHARLNLKRDKLNIGIACAGSSTHKNDSNRSMPLEAFSPLQDMAHFFLLQKEISVEDRTSLSDFPHIKYLGEAITDFTDSAAIVQNLDLVISVDTSLVHLAGALGKPVWALLAFAPDWRWLLNRSDSPWYPSATLFRQPQPGDWHSVMMSVKQSLLDFPQTR